MTDNLPAVPDRPSREIVTQDVDSWIPVLAPVIDLARSLASTDFVPKGLRGNTTATAAAILYGREVGLPPMTALTQTHVIEGKPAMSAEAMRAMILSQGHELVIDETTTALCRMRGRRAGSDQWTEIVWTMDLARQAGVASKGVWKSYPRQMLQARCTTEIARLVFPDVIHGFRSIEELDYIDGEVPEEQDGESTTTVQRAPRKRAAARKAAAPPAPVAERPALEGPPLPGEPGYDPEPAAAEQPAGGDAQGEGTDPLAGVEPDDSGAVNGADHDAEGQPMTAGGLVAEAVPAAPESSTDDDVHDVEIVEDEPAEPEEPKIPPAVMSRAQQRMVFGMLGKLEITSDAERHLIAGALLGRDVESFNHLSKREGSQLVDTIARCSTRAELDALIDAADQHRSES